MVKVIASSIRKGNVVDIDNKLYVVLVANNIHPGKGTPVTQLDLRRLEGIDSAEGETLRRYVSMIQVQRDDFNGRVLTIRRDDLRAIAAILGVGQDQAAQRLDALGLTFEG